MKKYSITQWLIVALTCLIAGIGATSAASKIQSSGVSPSVARQIVQLLGFSQEKAQPFTIVSTTSTQPATTTRYFGSVDPQLNNQYNLGDPGFAWANVNASGTATLGTLVVGAGGCTGCGAGGGSQVMGSSTIGTLTVTSTAIFQSGFISQASSSVSAGLQVAGNLSVSSTETVGTSLVVSSTPTVSFANNVAHFGGNANNYIQVNQQNMSNGNNASGNWIITADNGTDSSYYVDLGLNGSGYAQPSTFPLENAGDAFLYNNDGAMLIGTPTSSAKGRLIFFTGGSGLSNERLRIDNNGNIIVASSTNNPLGKLSIDTSGNLSTSGTIQTYGGVTSTALSTFKGGIISNASSSVGAGLQVAGNLSASSSLTWGTNAGGSILSSTGDIVVDKNSADSATGKLQIKQGAAAQAAFLEFLNNETGNNSDGIVGIERSTGGGLIGGTTGYALVVGQFKAQPVQIATNNAVNVTIPSGGGIIVNGGTTASSSFAGQLNVVGNISASSTITSSGCISVNGDCPASTKIFAAGGGPTEDLQNNAVGTTEVLRLENPVAAAAGAGPEITFNGATPPVVQAEIVAGWNAAATTDGYMLFKTRNAGVRTEQMRISSVGNVGIGTANPTYQLNVQGAGAMFGVSNGATTSSLEYNKLVIASSTSNGLGLFYVDPSGNVNVSGTIFARNNLNVSSTAFLNGVATSTATGLSVNSLNVGNSNLTISQAGQIVNNTSQNSVFGGASGSAVAGTILTLVAPNTNNIPLRLRVATGQTTAYQAWDNLTTGITQDIVDQNGRMGLGPGATFNVANQLVVSGNIMAGNGTVTSTYGSNFLAIATSTSNNNGLFYVDSSGNVSASGTLTAFGLSTFNAGVSVASSSGAFSVSSSGLIYLNNLPAAAASDVAVCQNSGTNLLTIGPGTTCVVSTRRQKHDIQDLTIEEAEHIVDNLTPRKFLLNGSNDPQIGFIAEEAQLVDPRLVALDKDGIPATFRYEEYTSALTKVLQARGGEIEAIKKQNEMLVARLNALEHQSQVPLQEPLPESLGQKIVHWLRSLFK